MEEKQNNSTFKKVKLNYMHAVSRTPPKAKIKVSSAKMEELNKAIIEKTRQNNAVFNAAAIKSGIITAKTVTDIA